MGIIEKKESVVLHSPSRGRAFRTGRRRIGVGLFVGFFGQVLVGFVGVVFFLFRFVVVSGVSFSGEAFADGGGPAFASKGFDEFVLGERDRLRHDLREIGEGAGGFGLEAAGGDGFKDAADGPGEVGSGDVVAFDFVAKAGAGLLFGELGGFLACVGIAEVRM